MTDRENLKKGK